MWATRQAVGGGGTKEGAKAKGMVGSVRWFDINVRSFVVYLPVRSKIRLAAGAGAETVCTRWAPSRQPGRRAGMEQDFLA